MEHPGTRYLHPDDENFAVLTPRMVQNAPHEVVSLINMIGSASSQAQNLSHTITTFNSFASGDNTMYILFDDSHTRVLGFVKIGPRHLFLWDHFGVQHEMQPICLLDFFTYPECQRRGYGKKMIDEMLKDNRMEMSQIPIDRPSSLCLSFMAKHFGLVDYVPQSNNFVVFDQFWNNNDDFNNLPPAIISRQNSNLYQKNNYNLNNNINTPQFETGKNSNIGRPTAKFILPPNTRKENNPSRVNAPITNVLKQICNNPARKAHYNPITWSLHPGISQ